MYLSLSLSLSLYIYIYIYIPLGAQIPEPESWLILTSECPCLNRVDQMLFFSGRLAMRHRIVLETVVPSHAERLHQSALCACHPCAGAMLIFSASFQC